MRQCRADVASLIVGSGNYTLLGIKRLARPLLFSRERRTGTGKKSRRSGDTAGDKSLDESCEKRARMWRGFHSTSGVARTRLPPSSILRILALSAYLEERVPNAFISPRWTNFGLKETYLKETDRSSLSRVNLSLIPGFRYAILNL